MFRLLRPSSCAARPIALSAGLRCQVNAAFGGVLGISAQGNLRKGLGSREVIAAPFRNAAMHQHARAGLPEFASDEPADPSVDPVTSAVFPLSFSMPSPRFWCFIRKMG